MSDVLHLTHEEADELAGLFVLDALTPAEADAMREHLATCPESHADLAELAAVTPALAALGGTVDAPAELRGRVLATLAATPQVPDDVSAVAVAGLVAPVVAPSTPVLPAPGPVVAPSRPVMPVVAMPPPSRRSAPSPVPVAAAASSTVPPAPSTRRPWAWMSIAIVVVIGVVGLMGWNVLLQKSNSLLNDRVAMVRDAIAAEGQPGAHVAPLTGTGPATGATGFAVFPANSTGFIVMQGMPPVTSQQTYQAWYIAGDQVTSAGLMNVGTDGLAVLGGLDPVAGTDTVALTLEPAGGSQVATTAPIVVGKLSTPTAWLGFWLFV